MTGNDIRNKFLQYFADQGHTVVESSPLVPHDDPTLLFTNAGMVQFKRVFMGEDKRDYVRAVTAQRCVRAGGKHNDLENVGYTARHHTFFEMLGNFSFGDYFKEDAIRFAWDFLTNVLGLAKERLWVSVFEEDDEAFALWQKIEGLPDERIIRLGEKDNFWAMGDTGPCGPCSEILYDQGEAVGCGKPDCRAGCDCDRYLELWNLVFMQFYRDENGGMTPLPKPSIDTGMGLERVSAVLQGKYNNFDSDLFAPLTDAISAKVGKKYGQSQSVDTAFRVIADHSRATAFLVADGVLPSNEGRGYVLRRIMRRAIRFGRLLGMTGPFLSDITATVIDHMRGAYPHLESSRPLLGKVVRNEEERFFETLDNGIAKLQEEIGRLKTVGSTLISGDFIFKLYDTFGFPVDIVKDVAHEEGLIADEAGFNEAMAIQRQQSKKSWKGAGLALLGSGLKDLLGKGERIRFVGYECRRHHSVIGELLDNKGNKVDRVQAGDEVTIVCPETPFYAESGGQAGDHGEIAGPAGRAVIVNTVSAGEGLIVHQGIIEEGFLARGDAAEMRVAETRRHMVACNHTATHLLHAALKNVLGEHVRQSGSLVEAERLRFDFTHFSPVSANELEKVEKAVNEEIRLNTALQTAVLDRDEAIKSGATALFGEKYDSAVRVVSIGEGSRELCGGTHVGATGEIGVFKIVSEGGIAAGVRRIEAVTGPAALERFQNDERMLAKIAAQLKSGVDEIEVRLEKVLARQKELEKEIDRLRGKLSTADISSVIDNARVVGGIRVAVAKLPIDSAKTMRDVGDTVRDRLGSGIAVIGASFQDKANLLVIVSQDLTGRYHAGNLVKALAQIIGGSGGGRADMAQAGGPLADKLPEALEAVYSSIEKMG